MNTRENTPIFGAIAPTYFAKKISVIPLHYHDKIPIPTGWQLFHDQLPTPDVQAGWIQNYSNCNVGVVLGKQSNLMMIDIDTTDDAIQNLLLKLLPPSPWQRVGQKGMALAYQFTGIKNFKIKDSTGKMIVEALGTKNQLVLPPSVHPGTGLPYIANCNLLDVIDQLPVLPEQIESILRGALSDRARADRVHVVTGLVAGETPSTKAALASLRAVTEAAAVLVVAERGDDLVWMSLRNVPEVHLLAPDQLNTYDVLCSDDVVFTSGALEAFLAGPTKGKGAKAVATSTEAEAVASFAG